MALSWLCSGREQGRDAWGMESLSRSVTLTRPRDTPCMDTLCSNCSNCSNYVMNWSSTAYILDRGDFWCIMVNTPGTPCCVWYPPLPARITLLTVSPKARDPILICTTPPSPPLPLAPFEPTVQNIYVQDLQGTLSVSTTKGTPMSLCSPSMLSMQHTC